MCHDNLEHLAYFKNQTDLTRITHQTSSPLLKSLFNRNVLGQKFCFRVHSVQCLGWVPKSAVFPITSALLSRNIARLRRLKVET